MDKTVNVSLNGLELTFDSQTGSIIKMEYPGPGIMLDTDSNQAGLVDVAYPIETFEALRLASRYSSGADIKKTDDSVTIHWSKLGPNRSWYKSDGDVSATVVLRALPDGRSVSMSCEVENKSKIPVKQVVFPDFNGLVPFAGVDSTILKTCGFGSAPFRELQVSSVDQWYAVNNSLVEHASGGAFHSMWLRWLDLGGLNGGFSLFPKRWGWDPQAKTVLKMTQATKKIRMMSLHAVEVKPGEKWSSGEYILTPHKNGWAKGIEVYKDWAMQNVKREYPVPKHVREGLGFRSIWMCQNQPADPEDVVWKINDIPKVAKEAKEHGLDEMVLWTWNRGFDIPFGEPYPHLGTLDDLVKAVAESKKMGVNISPFISVIQANKKTADRYGLVIPDNNGWTYHTEMLPRWNPPYATGFSCVQVGPANEKWQNEVTESCKNLIDLGITSVCWDQYFSQQEQPDIYKLTSRIRAIAKKADPESTFSAEELWNMELDSNHLDYTWNWKTYGDNQAFMNAFPAPRINCNINDSESEVKFAFMDNFYLNVWPSKPDSINGSDYIVNHPVLSSTLKQCASLRKQFLPYFKGGVLIGNCMLTEASPGCRVISYVCPDRVMALVLNQTGGEQPLSFKFDLVPWVKSASHKYDMKSYDGNGKLIEQKEISSRVKSITTAKLKPLEITVYEFIAK
ncbi:MAG: DUF6259 domain-containing protein [Armatimonadota bacterium]